MLISTTEWLSSLRFLAVFTIFGHKALVGQFT
jgi:hypothetical protein